MGQQRNLTSSEVRVTDQSSLSLLIPSFFSKELRSQLFTLFSTYGKVIDVVATRANGMRGQAFIVFKDLQASTAALRALDGFQFYDKPMVSQDPSLWLFSLSLFDWCPFLLLQSIDYAKFKSNATLIQEHGPAALYNPMLFNSDQDQRI